MRGLPYFILAYVALGAQVGLGTYMRVGGAPPNIVLLAVLFIALNAPKEVALLGCFGLGIMQDLLTQQTLGLYALSYGIVGMFVISTQQLVYRDHPLTHLAVGLGGSVICAIVLAVHGVLRLKPDERIGPGRLIDTVIYTTILAPLVLGALQKLRRSFRFQSRRARM